MAQHLNFDADTIDVHFISGTFDIARLEAGSDKRLRRSAA